MPELYRVVEAAILESNPGRKCGVTRQIFNAWGAGELDCDPRSAILSIDDPGRPQAPSLVDPRRLPRRSSASPQGRILLLHAVAHIEFNAINIALDAVYRFRRLPRRFIDDWLFVAQEEARHFTLLSQELNHRNSFYGAFDAHRGLWDMVCQTRADALHRMALVPRVMEARGLDVTPGMIARLRQGGDMRAVEILETIYRDEIGHVRIGNYWYRRLCSERGLDADTTFADLIERYVGSPLRGPFNWPARLEAGFHAFELETLERGPV